MKRMSGLVLVAIIPWWRRHVRFCIGAGEATTGSQVPKLWRKLSARTLRSFGRHHLGYADPHGMLELRKSVCAYLQVARAARCEPWSRRTEQDPRLRVTATFSAVDKWAWQSMLPLHEALLTLLNRGSKRY